MKKESLMIGDLVCEKEDTNYQFPMKVVSIYDKITVDFGEKFTIGYEIENRLADYNPEDLMPIPLTEEILIKNGLNFHEGSDCFEEDKKYILQLYPYKKNVYCDIDGIWWDINNGEYQLIQLEYVHDLQHALKLCKIDKKIEL